MEVDTWNIDRDLKDHGKLRISGWRTGHSRGDRVHLQVYPERSRRSQAGVYDGVHGLVGDGESRRKAGSRRESVGSCTIDV